MQIEKFKSQLTFAFVAAVNHLSRPLRKHKFTSVGSKAHGLWVLIGGFRSVNFNVCCCISGFLACDCNYDWQEWKMWLWRWLLNFRSSPVFEMGSKPERICFLLCKYLTYLNNSLMIFTFSPVSLASSASCPKDCCPLGCRLVIFKQVCIWMTFS